MRPRHCRLPPAQGASWPSSRGSTSGAAAMPPADNSNLDMVAALLREFTQAAKMHAQLQVSGREDYWARLFPTVLWRHIVLLL